MLPALPIPLRPPDADVSVNLQAVFATTYERGRYRPEVDYQAAAPRRMDEAEAHLDCRPRAAVAPFRD